MSGPDGESTSASVCASCGAPDAGELVMCKFCEAPYNAEAARTAVPCPSCRTACRWGKQKCPKCQAWIVVTCIFCGSLSPHNISNCLHCNEAFAGAPQRRAAQEQQRQTQSALDMASVAAPFLGAAFGAVVASSFSGDGGSSSFSESFSDSSSSNDEVETFDNSNMTEEDDT